MDLAAVYSQLTGEDWAKCVFKRPGRGKLVASPVALKRGPAVKLVETVGKREETRTVPLDKWPEAAQALLEGPLDEVHVLGAQADWHARRSRKGRWLVSRGKPSLPGRPTLQPHDRAPRHPLPPDDPAVARLFAATGADGDKIRQVQHYIELLRPLPIWSQERRVRVVDAGCGKAYMSLGLYLWASRQGVGVDLVGVDSNAEVVERVRGIAAELGYEGARFEAATILDYARRREEPVDLLVSLHACDTATDEAIAAGVMLDAEAIVLAPCCQHECLVQINSALETEHGTRSVWAPVLEHGILRSRLADLVTDSLRSSALEALGYRAEAIEFVAAEHTTKNLMIRAVKRPDGRRAESALREYRTLADAWGVRPTLETLVALDGRHSGA